MRHNLLVAAILGIFAGLSFGQTTAPTTAPERYEITIPPGFHTLSVGDYTVVCEPADEQWVRAALKNVTPATMPSTRPADLRQRLWTKRAELKQQMIADLAVHDAASVDKLFADTLIPAMMKLENLRPPIFYMPCSKGRLIELLLGGWKEARFHYNRAADVVEYNPTLRLSLERPMDETLVPAQYEPGDSPEERQRKLIQTIQSSERQLAYSVAGQGQFMLQRGFARFITDQIMTPMKLKPDQEWLVLGAMGVLSTRYASQVTGVSEAALMADLTYERRGDPRTPIMSSTIDLLHPLDMSALRPEAVPFQMAAVGRKASKVVVQWLKEAGPGALAQTLEAMRKQPPADGPALVKLIKETTKVDLEKRLVAE